MAIDYREVLKDLESRRKKLDAAIPAIKEIVGQEYPPKIEDKGGKATKVEPVISHYGSLTHMEAIEACLKEDGPQTVATLTKLLQNHGRGSGSKYFYNTVYKSLLKGKESGTLEKIGKKWYLLTNEDERNRSGLQTSTHP